MTLVHLLSGPSMMDAIFTNRRRLEEEPLIVRDYVTGRTLSKDEDDPLIKPEGHVMS